MFCPVCRGQSTRVLDSRDSRDGGIRRRRQCLECGHRFTTRERVETTMPVVLKRSGSRQNFDRQKILSGLQVACRKRPVSADKLGEIVHAVELWAATRGEKEILAQEIGARIMHHLYETDQVAYVRFVSVYRSFNTAQEFEQLLVEMEKGEHVSVDGQRNLFEFDEAGRAILPADAQPGAVKNGKEAKKEAKKRAKAGVRRGRKQKDGD
ncbi:MAG TPA: transcriptional repressor NrdR [Nannocystis exedens]|nr:transcriptional repressor NrdR [Nannocystis exedens]